MNPTISVIIPVYNDEKTLTRCVRSIIMQDYRPLQIVLVDDGSTDGSPEICDKFSSAPNRGDLELLVLHKENGGASSARNAGIEMAAGPYIAFVDSDDMILPEYFSDLMRLQQDEKGYGHVCCGFKSLRYGNKSYLFSSKEDISSADRRDYMELFEKIMVQSPCQRLYKTDIIKQNHIRMRTSLSKGEDLLFNLLYFDSLDNTKIGILNKANYIYDDRNGDSLSHCYREDLLSINTLLSKEIKKYLIKWDVFDQKSKTKYYNHVFYYYSFVLDNTFHPDCQWSLLKKIRYNNAVLRRRPFKEALRQSSVSLPLPLKLAYKSGYYPLVFITQKLYDYYRMIASFRRSLQKKNSINIYK